MQAFAILGVCLCILAVLSFLSALLVQHGRILLRLEKLERSEGRPNDSELPGPRLSAREAPPSLFIVSLPRSFSSRTYIAALAALRLRQCERCAEGEILNYDRYAGYGKVGAQAWTRFARKELHPETFYLNRIVLDHVVQPKGYIYKDVVQPFVVADWLS
jgi:hypothetical protein